jgi:hypothetical protein
MKFYFSVMQSGSGRYISPIRTNIKLPAPLVYPPSTTNQTKLTTWSRVILEQPTVTQLVRKFPTIYETRRFITVFTRSRHWFLSPETDAASSHPPTLHPYLFVLILSSHIFVGLPRGLLPFRFCNQNIVCISPHSHPCYMLHRSHPHCFDHTNTI